ncbi:MAG: tryptophan--tRNA ligase [Candidatus Brennerbacteria bacterium CG11_big_fil_rev_8_21_14_0_20_43_10]|uniref:Tryptophan--tRNA ligase n=3 Tax=Candidatus Brenneribacteriota TaxID=1817902 RepID=A0A2M8C368_9BACT|nr:MAG: tryptophan--tRNA ligase [Parcubacteria group bacterium CG1_02_44_31]PIP50319.1 MAG: tryptophan--tRNA ligase [Candidatus Brennerbacteria bacterium CG23_combo_of_CG06-09_8_20_14_all_44_41]PIR26989.1 MAG: tryptophan--tRNA ligase [Candidatus Brennerbacteria bacterium CG11_big_fil_rev_8_21_14_0_20_43_10]PIX28813.1 MAG: tryptophan--tRNA ligase [Candidatus Brennerbacteria bacterium CG_4_8_14_3_um_filter_43_14]PJA19810.1 MAG: tryptophan--tRNA ligase [Candidatus Brennerbacteria bacterium CG_4_10
MMRILSGIRSSGQLTIANYLGAISQFIALQNEHECFYFIADLHAITTPYDPKTFSHNVLDVAAMYLAFGLDPLKTTMFLQSLIPEHTQLQWLLATITPMGELERMTQYKEKTHQGDPADVGLFMYPVLMAADILLYKPQAVPVGEDQVQHVELTRSIAEKFNKRFGETFPLPEPKTLDKAFSRIKSLQDPAKKMSKSDDNQKASIGLMDTPEQIRAKMKSAVTDSKKDIVFNPNKKPAISNLLTIASGFSGLPITMLEQQFKGASYADFKMAVADMIIEKLTPMHEKYYELIKDKKKLKNLLVDHSHKAQVIASETLKEVQEKMGLAL